MKRKNKTVRVVAYRHNRIPEVIQMDNTLEAQQKFVDGYIQIVPLLDTPFALCCNEEGVYEKADEYQFIYRMFGDFFIGKEGMVFKGTEDQDIQWIEPTDDELEFIQRNVHKLLLGVNRI